MKKVLLAIIAVFISAFLISAQEPESKVKQIDPVLLKEAIGAEVNIVYKTEPLKHICLFKEQSNDKTKPDAFLFNTGDLQLSANGYRGNVDCYVIISPNGIVLSVIVGENQESPKYLQRVLNSGFLKKWQGKKPDEEAPETVTGATFTSTAINTSVNNLRLKLKEINFF